MATTPCQFFNSPKGCRNSDSCRFLHSSADPALPTPPLPSSAPQSRPRSAVSNSQRPSPITVTASASDRARSIQTRAPVKRPVPKSLQGVSEEQAQASLRAFELAQVKSRFGSTFSQVDPTAKEETDFTLEIIPSDPDFPYEISSLRIRLHIPTSYPAQPCSLSVLNKDIPKGFSTNLERGFQNAALQKKSILAHLNWLDVNMEQLLQKPPAPTIRFVGHGSQVAPSKPAPVVTPTPVSTPAPVPISTPVSAPIKITSSSKPMDRPSWTRQQLEQAEPQRQQQLTQIQARFRSSFDPISATEVRIALDSANKKAMPLQWEGPLWINILLPKAYPLEPCEIRLKEEGSNPEIELWRARNVEQGFRKIVSSMPQLSLFQLFNQLNRDLKDLLNLPEPSRAPPRESTPPPPSSASSSSSSFAAPLAIPPHSARQESSWMKPSSPDSKGRTLIYVDPPTRRNFEPGQDLGHFTSEDEDHGSDHDHDHDHSESNSGTESDTHPNDSNSDTDDDTEEGTQAEGGPSVEATPKRGIEIRMPGLKLDHISLVYCRSLSMLVRCNRCRSLIDMEDLHPEDEKTLPAQSKRDLRKWKTCDTCQSVLGAHFRAEYIHIQSRTLGYLDLAGCTAFDILPSSFVPTCNECDQVLGASTEGRTLPSDGSSTTSITASTADMSLSLQSSSPTGFRQKTGRGMSATANCRKCHVRLTLTLEGEIKFVRQSPGDLMKASLETLEQLPLKKKSLRRKNGLEMELKVGEPLPRKGACDHYKKSRRWFRFPCCSKIYPCHLCHDEKEADHHECEYAKRMICGHCSREQTVSDKACVCGHSPVKISGGSGAFWEGGEGMRDKTRMSNRDSKKYKGSNKTVAKKQVGAENIRKRAPKV